MVESDIYVRCDVIVSVLPDARSVRGLAEVSPWSKAETRTSSTEQ